MRPTFRWAAVPAPNDILRNDSLTPVLDGIASVFQVIMVAALCMVVNRQRQKPMKRLAVVAVAASVLFYYGGWVLYYGGNTSGAVILVLCLAPCTAFILFSIARKNLPGLLPAILFMICHTAHGVIVSGL